MNDDDDVVMRDLLAVTNLLVMFMSANNNFNRL